MENASEPKLYKEEGAVFDRVFLSDQEYAAAVSALVVVCADTLFFDKNKKVIFLARRKAKPMQNWWMFGGRVKAGEDARDAVVRLLKRELGVTIDSTSLTFLTMKRHWFKDRQQVPQTNACDSLCYTYMLPVDQTFVDTISSHLDPAEYETELGIRAFTREMLIEEKVDQSVVDLFDLVFP